MKVNRVSRRSTLMIKFEKAEVNPIHEDEPWDAKHMETIIL